MASLTRPLWSPYAAIVCDVNALSLVGAILLVKQLEVVEQEGPDQGDERLVLFGYQISHYAELPSPVLSLGGPLMAVSGLVPDKARYSL